MAAANPPLDTNAASGLAPLRRPVFRVFWGALIVSGLGSWMHDVGAGWLMATLAPDPVMVSLIQAASLLPLFLLTLPAGALADIVNRRRYLVGTQIWMMLAAGLLGLLTLSGQATAPLLIAFTFAMGSGTAMMMPAFSSVIPDLVPREELTAAITLNSIAFNAMRAVGPAIAGAILAVSGPGIVFLINAVSFSAVIWVLSRWRSGQPASTLAGERFLTSMRTGVRYVRQADALHAILLRGVALFLAMSAPLAFLPLFVKSELGAGPRTYGLLLGCVGAGAVLGGLQLARLRQRFSTDAIIRAGTVGVVLASLAMAWIRSVPLLAVAMLILGAAWISAQSTLQVTAQLSLPRWVRARGLAVFIATFMGVMAVGAPAWGKLAALTSLRWSLTAAAVLGLVGLALTWRLSLNRHAEADTTPAEPQPEPSLPAGVDEERGPVLVNVEYDIDPADAGRFVDSMEDVRRVRLRNGSAAWGLFQDTRDERRFVEVFLDETWSSHLRQHYRVTREDRRMIDLALSYHRGDRPPDIKHLLSPRDPGRRWRRAR